MKIYQINSVCGTGSTGRIAVDIYDKILAAGHECRIAYGRGQAPERINSYRVGSELKVKLHGVISRVFDNQGFLSTRATKDLIKDIKSYEPDIIHCHNLHGYYLNIDVLLSFFAEYKKPVVLTMHDCWTFTGHCAYFSSVDCRRWQDFSNGCHDCPCKGNYPASIVFDASKKHWQQKRELFKRLDRVVFVSPSDWLRTCASESFLAENPKASFITIKNGIDLHAFRYRPKVSSVEKVTILGVSTEWGRRKGQEDFERLIQDLDENFEIVMVGLSTKQQAEIAAGQEILEQSAKEIVIKGKSGARARLITRTESLDELCDWYNKASAFVNATREDNFPTVHLEALACGTGVITYDIGGSREAMLGPQGDVDFSLGRVIAPMDYQGLLDAILSLKDKNNSFDSESCRKAAESFEKNDKYQQYLDLYKELVKE